MTMPKASRSLWALSCCLLMTGLATAEPQYKIQLNPFTNLVDSVNIQVDRQVTDNMSTGLMLSYSDPSNDYYGYSNESKATSSIAIRRDRFKEGVFNSGWHSDTIFRLDFYGTELTYGQLELTQSYQEVRADFLVNLGLGLRVGYGELYQPSLYGPMLYIYPAVEFSIGRAF
jgi:hypothetical protein